MIFDRSTEDNNNWKQQIKHYQFEKRTRKPFGKQFSPKAEIITGAQIKRQQREFDPVLQKYQSQNNQRLSKLKQQNRRSYELAVHYRKSPRNYRDFDIVNLHGSQTDLNKSKDVNKIIQNPIRNVHNPVSNKPIPDFYYKGRRVQLPKQYNYKSLGPKRQEFDIVKCMYRQDNQSKTAKDIEAKEEKINQKYQKTHDGYNPIVGRYYNDNKQQDYEKDLAKSQLLYGSNYNKRFPPTYLSRQPLIFDHTKPPTQSLAALDQRRANAKKHYKLKHIIEEEYKRRNIQDYQKKESQRYNRIQNSHILKNQMKQFYLNNPESYPPSSRASSLYQQKSNDQLRARYGQSQNINQDNISNKSRGSSFSVKSSGFL